MLTQPLPLKQLNLFNPARLALQGAAIAGLIRLIVAFIQPISAHVMVAQGLLAVVLGTVLGWLLGLALTYLGHWPSLNSWWDAVHEVRVSASSGTTAADNLAGGQAVGSQPFEPVALNRQHALKVLSARPQAPIPVPVQEP